MVLIQWYDEHHSRTEVEQNIQNRELVDQWIVLLRDLENNEDVWEFAEYVVRWRVKRKSKHVHLYLNGTDQAFAGDTFATPKASEWLAAWKW